MPDDSHLDKKYFIDRHVYNCPYCNRRNVSYEIIASYDFDWTNNKKCNVYFVKCESCDKESMHLSYTNLISSVNGRFEKDIEDIDDLVFYSIPTSFFTIDSRIPKALRELFTEAEGCLKSNFLTGASACIRKIVYELSSLEKAEGSNYDERIKSLKTVKKDIDPTYFDTLVTIQQLTSDKVHENSYDNWESKHIRLILASLLEILNEIYVIPKEREEKRKSLLELKESIIETKKKPVKPNEEKNIKNT